jgi:glycosyltransferase involved in cell wall biosynthesis
VVIGNPIRDIISDADLEKENIILSVGRLIETKHHHELIQIFAEINPKNWRLVIVGDDALKQNNKIRLEALVKELNMQNKIILTGKRNDVDDFYNKAKIFAFTSSSEGFPNVIGEAMSASLPVVAYDCIAGPGDLIDHKKTGFLVDVHDTRTFKADLENLIKDEQLRFDMGQRAKEKIAQFSVDNIAVKFEKCMLSESITN